MEKLTIMTNAIKRFNETILWKWELDSMPNKPNNVIIETWLPQRDILCKYLCCMQFVLLSEYLIDFKSAELHFV